jgi:peptide/nickel transport system permease protein
MRVVDIQLSFPSILIALVLLLTIVSINLVGDQLRDVLNPRLRK